MAAADAVVPERYRGAGAKRFPRSCRSTSGWCATPTAAIAAEAGRAAGVCVAVRISARRRRGVSRRVRPAASLDAVSRRPRRAIATTRSSADAIVGDHDPAEVVLMEIEPRQQKTWPDFVVTEQMWGVRAVDTAEVTREGRRLYLPARRPAARQIKRIYNRVIPDELERKRIAAAVRLRRRPRRRVGRASGVVFPHQQVLDSLAARTRRCRRRVSSTASSSCRSIAIAICSSRCSHSRAAASSSRRPTRRSPPSRMPSASNYILQERIAFEPVIDTPEGPTQVEIRIMYVRDGERGYARCCRCCAWAAAR